MRCCGEVRENLLSREVLGRAQLKRIADRVGEQAIDPISMFNLYEKLVFQGHLDGIQLR